MIKWIFNKLFRKIEILEPPDGSRVPDESDMATCAGLASIITKMPPTASIALALNDDAEYRIKIKGEAIYDRELNEVLIFPIVKTEPNKKESTHGGEVEILDMDSSHVQYDSFEEDN